MKDIDGLVESMKSGGKKFVFTDEGDINKSWDIEITQLYDKIFKIFQPFLIDRITTFLNIDMNYYSMNTNTRSTHVVKPLLSRELFVKQQKESCNYQTSVDMLTYLQGNSRPYM